MRINERRRTFVEAFVKKWSLNPAIKFVSKKFKVDEATLRVDWSRRKSWPKEVFDQINPSDLIFLYRLGVHRTLQQIEKEYSKTTNPSCRVGLLKTKAQILFKLIAVEQALVDQDLLKRVEAMEKKLELLESGK